MKETNSIQPTIEMDAKTEKNFYLSLVFREAYDIVPSQFDQSKLQLGLNVISAVNCDEFEGLKLILEILLDKGRKNENPTPKKKGSVYD